MRFFIETFGCQSNELESGSLAGLLEREGASPAASPDEADWFLLNTCCVRAHAEQKVFSRLGLLAEWKRQKPSRRIGVIGCMAVAHRGELFRRFPEIDLVAVPDRYPLVSRQMLEPGLGNTLLEGWDPAVFPSMASAPGGRIKAYVEIMKGCDNHCAYCIVPTVRGPEVSRPLLEVLEEVDRLAREGTREIVLLGQNVNSYSSGGIRFPALLGAVGTAQGVKRVRFFTSHPKDLSDELIEVMASTPALCSFIHLPVQSGSDRVLGLMNRRYTRGYYLELVGRMRSFIPDIAVTTDLIVGFPGEEEEDFRSTLGLLESVRFDSVFSFKYSPREGTAAASLGDPVPAAVKEERLERLNAVAWEHARQRHEARVGKVEEVMVEEPADRTPDAWFGKTRQYKTAVFTAGERTVSPGDLVQVRIDRAKGATLYGTAV